MSFKQLYSRVAAITGPWNCVVYRDIGLLKAHSCSSSFSSNCVAIQLPNVLVGVLSVGSIIIPFTFCINLVIIQSVHDEAVRPKQLSCSKICLSLYHLWRLMRPRSARN